MSFHCKFFLSSYSCIGIPKFITKSKNLTSKPSKKIIYDKSLEISYPRLKGSKDKNIQKDVKIFFVNE